MITYIDQNLTSLILAIYELKSIKNLTVLNYMYRKDLQEIEIVLIGHY